MHLARHSITATTPTQILDARFDNDSKIFTTSTPTGYAVYSTWPLRLLRKRELVNGTLAMVLPLHTTSLLFLLGGGRSPLYPPNKVVVWDDVLGKEVAELEFRERVRGMACRRGWLVVALRRRVVVFQFGEQLQRWKEWDTCDNQRGLLALASAPHATLLAIPGLQTGHVHLIHLPPCPVPVDPLRPPPPPKPPRPTKHPKEMIIAHETALTTLTVPASGRLLATTSSRGTLIRIWDTHTGNKARELRRGTDQAEIYGVAFKSDESEICVWSDKGTIHVFRLGVSEGAGNRQSALAPLSPFLRLHKYFDSEWSYAHFRLPLPSSHVSLSSSPSIIAPLDEASEEERCVVCWVMVPSSEDTSEAKRSEHQLVALTYSGGWYRLALPSPTSQTTSTIQLLSTSSSQSVASPNVSVSPPLPPGFSHSRPSVLSQGYGSKLNTSSRSSVYGTPASSHDKGKGRQSDKDKEEAKEGGRRCTLVEFRKFGRWDGW